VAHCSTLVIDITLGNISKFWLEDEAVCAKVAFVIQNQRYLWNGWTLAYFSGEQNFSTPDISHTFCRSATKFGNVRGLANRNYSPNFVNFCPGIPLYHAATCISPSLAHL